MNTATDVTPMHRFRTEEILVDPGPPRMFASIDSGTFLVTLGTSTPSPNPYRFGPAGAVVANGNPYLIDAGEGILRAIAKAATSHGKLLVDCFAPKKLTRLFLTHLHSDHVVGLPSIILNPWIFGRTEPMEIFGPVGTRKLVDSILEGYGGDIHERINGAEHANDTGWRVTVHEIDEDGIVYEDGNLTVEAFFHEHGSMPNYGYVFRTEEKSVLWAGDGRVNEKFLEAARGVDFLVTEVCSEEHVGKAPWGGVSEEEKERIIWAYHLKPWELARLAEQAGIGTLVLTHESNYSAPFDINALYDEMRALFKGNLVASRDADVF